MNSKQPTILIIIGISGDLSRRKLLPAIRKMSEAGELSDKFRIVGITRQTTITKETLLGDKNMTGDYLFEHLELFSMDLLDAKDYERLNVRLKEIEKEFGEETQRLFYLSVPPQVSSPIVKLLGETKLSDEPRTKLLLEKPFGVDLESAKELIGHIGKYFKEESVYRIDHYLAKESVRNIITFRHDNTLFKRTWNKDFIERIEITAIEKEGINGRTVFYEQTGALRDFQSHLFQLAALVLMDLSDDIKDVPKERLDALQYLHLPEGKPIKDFVKRGQYENYRKETGNLNSTVETFVSLILESDEEQWRGVPITLTTGKSLDSQFTGITIFYKKSNGHEANKLTLRLQPNEGVELSIWAKKPGYDHQTECHKLEFAFRDHYKVFPEAYEQVFFDAINSDHTLFSSSDEILEMWRIVDVIQKAWNMSSDDLVIYEEGSNVEKVMSL